MLTSLEIANFKSFVDQSIAIRPLTLLCGANASGKSNVLEALLALKGLAMGLPLEQAFGGRTVGGTRVWAGIRGGLAGAFRSEAPIRCTTSWQISEDGYEHAFEIGRHGIHREVANNLWSAERDSERPKGDQLAVVFAAEGSKFAYGSEWHSVLATARDSWSRTLASAMTSIRLLDLHPNAMRAYSDVPTEARPELLPDGSNLSGVLFRLCNDEGRDSVEWLDWLQEFCAPEVESIEFERTETDQVMLRIREHGGTVVPARSMSDGTLQFLALLVALRSLTDGETLLIEDIDRGLHPTRLRLVLDAVHQHPWNGIREVPVVIATTHSPTFLEHAMLFEGTAPYLVSATPNGSEILDIRSIAGIEDAASIGGLANLFATDWMEQNR